MSSYNISATQGASLDLMLTAKNSSGDLVNLSGYNISGHVKNKYSETGILLDLAPAIQTPYESGILRIYLSSAQTAALPVARCVYDVEISSGTYCLKVLQGYFDINPEVTTNG
jgi:hypothetical protein